MSLNKLQLARRTLGFTMIEAMVVIAIIAILAAIAVPSMSDFIQSRRVESAARQLAEDMAYARNEAVKRNARVLFCQLGGANPCGLAAGFSATSWADGWLICMDRDANSTCDTGTATSPNPLRRRQALVSSVNLSGPTGAFYFAPDGSMTANTATITYEIRDKRNDVVNRRWTSIVAPSGAVTLKKAGV